MSTLKIQKADGSWEFVTTESDKIGDMTKLKTVEKSSLVNAVNELFQSASDVKTKVATAITGKGVPANSSDTGQVLADKIGQIKSGYGVGDFIPVNFLLTGSILTVGNIYSLSFDNDYREISVAELSNKCYVKKYKCIEKLDNKGNLAWSKDIPYPILKVCCASYYDSSIHDYRENVYVLVMDNYYDTYYLKIFLYDDDGILLKYNHYSVDLLRRSIVDCICDFEGNLYIVYDNDTIQKIGSDLKEVYVSDTRYTYVGVVQVQSIFISEFFTYLLVYAHDSRDNVHYLDIYDRTTGAYIDTLYEVVQQDALYFTVDGGGYLYVACDNNFKVKKFEFDFSNPKPSTTRIVVSETIYYSKIVGMVSISIEEGVGFYSLHQDRNYFSVQYNSYYNEFYPMYISGQWEVKKIYYTGAWDFFVLLHNEKTNKLMINRVYHGVVISFIADDL